MRRIAQRSKTGTLPAPTGAVRKAAGFFDVPIPKYLRLFSLVTLVCFGVALLPGLLGEFFQVARWFAFTALLVGGVLHTYRTAGRGLDWRLGDKLVIT